MKKALIVFSVVALFMIASCAIGQNQPGQQQADTFQTLQAELDAPSETALNEPVTLSVSLTYENEMVSNANEVDFEIWRDGARDTSKVTAAEEADNGTYSIETSFTEDGIYHIQANVSAEGNQLTPSQRIIAGDVPESDLEQAEQESHQELEDASDLSN